MEGAALRTRPALERLGASTRGRGVGAARARGAGKAHVRLDSVGGVAAAPGGALERVLPAIRWEEQHAADERKASRRSDPARLRLGERARTRRPCTRPRAGTIRATGTDPPSHGR